MVGETLLNKDTLRIGQSHIAENIIVHPDFNWFSLQSDIGIVIVSSVYLDCEILRNIYQNQYIGIYFKYFNIILLHNI